MHDDAHPAFSQMTNLDRPVEVPAVFHDQLLEELEQRLQHRPGHVRVPYVPTMTARASVAGLRRGFAIASGVAVVVAVLGISLGLLTQRPVDDDDTVATPTTLAVTTSTTSTLAPAPLPDPGSTAPIPDGWSQLDPGPVSAAGAGAVTWTGPGSSTGIAVWAGEAAWYEVESKVWRDLGTPPVPWSEDAQLLAAGKSMIAIAATGDIAVLDARTRAWGSAAARPDRVRHLVDAVWTGEDVYLLAHVQGQARLADELVLVSYDPAQDVWREMAAPSINLSYADLSWTGDRLIVYGGFLDSNNRPRDPSGFARGALYDPASDVWEDLPIVALSPNAVTSAWVGNQLLAWDYLHAVAAYRPDTGWDTIPSPPLDFSECYPQSAWTGDVFIAWYCGAAAQYSPAAGTWQSVQTPPESASFASGGFVRGDPIPADGSVYFWGARYNSDDVSFWRFDPADAVAGADARALDGGHPRLDRIS